jgi:hypothetical protein
MTIYRFKPLEMPQKAREIIPKISRHDLAEALADQTGEKAAKLLASTLERRAKIMGLIYK